MGKEWTETGSFAGNSVMFSCQHLMLWLYILWIHWPVGHR